MKKTESSKQPTEVVSVHKKSSYVSNLRMSYNPLLEDIFEAQEREAELERKAIEYKKEVNDHLKSLERDFKRKDREKRF